MVAAVDLEFGQGVAEAFKFTGESLVVVADGGDPSASLNAHAQRVAAAQVIVHGFPFAGLVDDGVATLAGFVAAALAAQRNGHALAQCKVRF
ncbi:hypothetical protein D3C72_1574210 [compost metagenome]